MFKNLIATNLLVPWEEISATVEIQRPYEKVRKVKYTAQTMRNPLLFLQSWLCSSVCLYLIQLGLPLCLLLLGEACQICLSERSQAIWWRGFIAASQKGREATAGLNGYFCDSTHSSQILVLCPGQQMLQLLPQFLAGEPLRGRDKTVSALGSDAFLTCFSQ